MIFYHVDRCNSLTTTGAIFPYITPPNNPISKVLPVISKHGVHFLLHNEPHFVSVLDEIVLEYARISLFPNMPSRFQCIFATKTLEEAKYWAVYWNLKQYRIVKIESEIYYELDCSWFTDTAKTGTLLNSYFEYRNIISNEATARIFEEAVKYWEGQRSNNPRLEVLIPLPIQVTAIIDQCD